MLRRLITTFSATFVGRSTDISSNGNNVPLNEVVFAIFDIDATLDKADKITKQVTPEINDLEDAMDQNGHLNDDQENELHDIESELTEAKNYINDAKQEITDTTDIIDNSLVFIKPQQDALMQQIDIEKKKASTTQGKVTKLSNRAGKLK